MFQKVVIKNPGCQYCRYFIPQFEHNGKLTTEACTKYARKMFEIQPFPGQKRKWKWNGCDYATEKNKNRLCQDFQIDSLTHKLINWLSLLVKNAKVQFPPTFSGEIWWEP